MAWMGSSLETFDDELRHRIFDGYNTEEWDSKYINPIVEKYVNGYLDNSNAYFAEIINKIASDLVKQKLHERTENI